MWGSRVQKGLRDLGRVGHLGVKRYNSTYPPSLLSLRVAQIVQVELHPNASKLYVSQVKDSQDPQKPLLQICSGLVPYLARDALLNSRIVIVTNLKPSKMRGERSEAMLLAASDNDAVELVTPPASAELGDAVRFQGHETAEPSARVKSKALEDILTKIKTNDLRQVVYGEDSLLVNDKGDACVVSTLQNATVR